MIATPQKAKNPVPAMSPCAEESKGVRRSKPSTPAKDVVASTQSTPIKSPEPKKPKGSESPAPAIMEVEATEAPVAASAVATELDLGKNDTQLDLQGGFGY